MNFTLYSSAAGAALMLMAGAASAQGLCGTIGATGTWIGGSPEVSDIATASGPFTQTGVAIPQEGSSVALFSLSSVTEVRIEALPAPGGDSVIELYDAAGQQVITDDDSGGYPASRAETLLQPGDYCLLTRGFAGGGLTADVRVGLLEHEALTEGLAGGFGGGGFDGGPFFVGIDPCTAATVATPLGNGPIDAQIVPGQPGISATNTVTAVPYYRFTLASPQAVSIRANNPTADPYIYIFDDLGTLLAENDDYNSLNSRVDFTTPLAAGTYCVGMRALYDPNEAVTLEILGYDAASALAELYSTGEAAPPLDGSYPVTSMGVLPARAVRDVGVPGDTASWFSFEMTTTGVVVIDAVEVTDSDPVIIVYDELGTEIAYNDDANGTLNSQVILRLQSGRYLMAVRQYSDYYNGIIRIATERYVPATE